MKALTLGSLFDGIGGFPLAAQRCGIKAVWASEIESNCIEITKRHFPHMAHLGDITELHGGEIPPVDIISFGSPCQDLSVAGNQAGIDGERSKLFHEAVRIIYEMREATNGKYPTFIIWENVAGAFSSNGGNDFRTVIEEITKTRISMPCSGKWATAGMVGGSAGGANIAWRLFDSEYWGVPQRRKRIYLVGDFRANRAPQILFERESVLGYIKKSRKEKQDVAAAFVGSFEAPSGDNNGNAVVDFGRTGDRIYINPDKSRTITASDGGGGSPTGLYFMNEVYPIRDPSLNRDANGFIIGKENDPAPTLTVAERPAVAAVCFTPSTHSAYKAGFGTMRASAGKHGYSSSDLVVSMYENYSRSGYREGCGTLRANGGDYGGGSENIVLALNSSGNGIAGTLDANYYRGTGARSGKEREFIAIIHNIACFIRYELRRLTPLECERLQGFPDRWTKYTSTGGEIIDKARYTALGNSLTVLCAERVFRGIIAVVRGDI